ncbi:MAG: pyruvate kinase [Candidatus Hydrogenedentota bacterium]
MSMRRTKIVCTIGPRSKHPDMLRKLIENGMNVARLNFSHGAQDDHRETYQVIRRLAAELGKNVAILMDLQGPKIRTGKLHGGEPVLLVEGAPIVVTTEAIAGTVDRVSTTYQHLPNDVKSGDRILIADGTLELLVEKVAGSEVSCVVVRGGLLGQNKGINLPGVAVSTPSLTAKDIEDLEFGIGLGVDFVALSFVRRPEDIVDIKKRIALLEADTPVVAKIERPEALECFDRILDVTDAVMVARGDLGVEVALQRVPQIQKTLIRMCNERGIPVITATQMLESMIANSRPTRAEAADVANAIYDGTDAVMLSGETAAGDYPIEAVRVMHDIALNTDAAIACEPIDRQAMRLRANPKHRPSFRDAICQAAIRMSQVVNVQRFVVLTQSGYTAEGLARYRPKTPIVAITLCESTRRRCALIWGVDAIVCESISSMQEMYSVINELLVEEDLVHLDEDIAIVAGFPLRIPGRTNVLMMHTVGDTQGLA